MDEQTAIVVTTINAPTQAMTALQGGAGPARSPFYVIGDSKSPPTFDLPGCRWFDVAAQQASGLRFAEICPPRHYARKNIGYLLAMRDGARVIVETDDDNIPRPEFFNPRAPLSKGVVADAAGWCNVYRYFSDALIWPRGLPLDQIQKPPSPLSPGPAEGFDCPIQQGLADENPDVDALYRLILPLPQNFKRESDVVLAPGTWCPFNSQNTTFWRKAFPLLYLPFHCSFRMTDIWRSFVAQRLAWECGWRVSFHNATVWQARNEHDLMTDFVDEVPGYLNNQRIRQRLEDLALDSGEGALGANMRRAYEALVELGVVGGEELTLLDAWRADMDVLGAAN